VWLRRGSVRRLFGVRRSAVVMLVRVHARLFSTLPLRIRRPCDTAARRSFPAADRPEPVRARPRGRGRDGDQGPRPRRPRSTQRPDQRLRGFPPLKHGRPRRVRPSVPPVAALSGKTCRSALRGPSGPTMRLSPPTASMTPPSAHCLPAPWIGPMLLEPCFLRSPKSRTSTDRDALRHSFDPCSDGFTCEPDTRSERTSFERQRSWATRLAPLPPVAHTAQNRRSERPRQQPTHSIRWLTGNRSNRPAIDEAPAQERLPTGSRIATHST
jgi:hypothetical protein